MIKHFFSKVNKQKVVYHTAINAFICYIIFDILFRKYCSFSGKPLSQTSASIELTDISMFIFFSLIFVIRREWIIYKSIINFMRTRVRYGANIAITEKIFPVRLHSISLSIGGTDKYNINVGASINDKQSVIHDNITREDILLKHINDFIYRTISITGLKLINQLSDNKERLHVDIIISK